MFASFDRCSNCAGSKEGSNESFDSGAFSSGPTLASPWQWPRDGRAMDVQWTRDGRAMDARWTCNGRAMDAGDALSRPTSQRAVRAGVRPVASATFEVLPHRAGRFAAQVRRMFTVT